MKKNLRPYVLKKSDLNEEKYPDQLWCLNPFTIVDKRMSVWNVGANQCSLVAFQGESHYDRWGGSSNGLSLFLNLIHSNPDSSYRVELSELRKWMEGKEVGVFFGILLDLSKLEKLLKVSYTGRYHFWDISSVAKNPCVAMGEEGVRAYLMGMVPLDCNKEPCNERIFDFKSLGTLIHGPVGEDRVEERSVFDLAMSLDGE